MQINQLTIENLRNIKFAQLTPNKYTNFIVGDNGAGKTSLLESIYLLARAKSFREQSNRSLIKEEEEQLNLFARVETSEKTRHRIGLKKTTNKTIIRRDGETLKKLSTIAKSLPLTIISPNIQRLVEDEPKYRRRLLNWGMFHVEHQYSDLASRYKKALIQRNSALRQSTSQLKVWDKELEVLGSEISRRMVNYTSLWNQAFKKMQIDLDVTKPIELQMKQGWKEGLSLQEAMERNRSVDIERGFTSTGPHRSDISILREGKLVKNIFSRGESKLTAVLMLLSQITISERMTGESPIVLIDDLHSELDNKRYHKLISLISALKLQTFITTLNFGDADISSVKEGFSVFHVEHGQLVDH